MPTVEGFITNKDVKEGEKNGKPWALFKYKVNDNEFGTFDKKLSGFVVGDFVKILAEKTEYGNNILTMESVSVEMKPSEAPQAGTVFIRHSEVMLAAVRLLETVYKVGFVSNETFTKSNTSPVDMAKQIYTALLAEMKRTT